MAYTDYTAVVRQSITAATVQELRWEVALAVVTRLLADPVAHYVCRGSSVDGTVTGFSATPDGVNRWAGKTQAQAIGSGKTIWIILESSKTGHQVGLQLASTSGPASTLAVIFSLNKFETAGAWRAGGTAVGTRPADTTSSPAAGRELATATGSLTPQSVSNQYYSTFIRKDGRGFYACLVREVSPSATSDGSFFGYFPFNVPHETDLNPYLAFATNNSAFNSVLPFNTNSGGNFVGRLQDGTLQEHRAMYFDDETSSGWLDRLNGWRAAYPMHAIAFRSVTTKDIRYWMPDWYIASGTTPASSAFATRDGKKSYRYSPQSQQWAAIGPWDGVTTAGTDVPVFPVPAPPVPIPTALPVDLPPAAEVPLLTKTPWAPGRPGRLNPELGIDVGCVLDADESWSLVSGETNLAHALARRLSTPRGGLFYAPNYGFDVRSLLSADLNGAEVSTYGPAIEDECEKDERVQSCTADLTYNFAAETLTIKLIVTTAAGPFELILNVSALTVDLLGVASI